MKKIVNLLLKHVEKIIFAFTMIVLIVLISIQLKSFKAVQKKIYDAKVAAGNLQTGGAIKPVPSIDLDVFDMKIDIQEPWMPAYTAGDWKSYKEGKDSRIFGALRRPPATLTDSYQVYIEEFGAGTMFDPPLYVRPLDKKSNMIAFESPYAFYSPYTSDIDTSSPTADDDDDTTGDDDDDDDDTAPPTADFEPATLVRIYKVRSPVLKFYLSSVMAPRGADKEKWTFTFKTVKGDKFVSIGKPIEATEFTLIDASSTVDNSKGFPQTVYTAVVAPTNAPDQTIKMKEGKKGVINTHGETSYEIVYFYPKRKIYKVKDGDNIRLRSPSKSVKYDVQGEGSDVSLVESGGKEYKLQKYSESEYKRWVRSQRPE